MEQFQKFRRRFKNNQKKIITAFRLIFGIAFALSLIQAMLKITGGDPWKALRQADTFLLLAAILIHGLLILISSYRWKLLLQVQKISIQIWDVIKLTLIGVFFNLALPGSVSGDLIKMGLIAQAAKTRKIEGVFTIILDRTLGLLGLFIVASISVLVSLPLLLDLDQKYRFIQVSAFIVSLGSLGGTLVIALIEMRKNIMNYRIVSWIVSHGGRLLPASVVSIITKITNALELYRNHRGVIVLTILLSVLIHSCYAFNVFLVSRSIGTSGPGFSGFFLAVPVANAVAAIPVTPGGIGTRDATIAAFLASMKTPVEIVGVVPFIITLIILIWGLIGGIVFMFYRSSQPKIVDSRFKQP